MTYVRTLYRDRTRIAGYQGAAPDLSASGVRAKNLHRSRSVVVAVTFIIPVILVIVGLIMLNNGDFRVGSKETKIG